MALEEELLLRQMPHSVEAEQSVLGSILIDARCIPEVIETLKPEDFYLRQNREIYETIYSMFNFSQTVDPITVLVGQQAATITYYKSKLWVASYNELSAGYLGSYTIVNKNATPSLKLCSRIKVANRIQGMAFTSKGYLILSRSCQTNSKQRGFLHQLDVYKPNVKKASKGIIKLGRVRKHIDMPTMNEEIAISGSYLYVNYESGAFSTAVNRMDRICAFKVSAVTK